MAFRSPWALIVAMPLVRVGSYYWIEKPTTQFGHRLTRAESPVVHANFVK